MTDTRLNANNTFTKILRIQDFIFFSPSISIDLTNNVHRRIFLWKSFDIVNLAWIMISAYKQESRTIVCACLNSGHDIRFKYYRTNILMPVQFTIDPFIVLYIYIYSRFNIFHTNLISDRRDNRVIPFKHSDIWDEMKGKFNGQAED